MKDQFLQAALQGAAEARAEARPDTTPFTAHGDGMKRGEVLAVNGNGTYTVGLVGAGGAVARTVENVPAWGASFAVGDRVAVVFEGGKAVPWIAGTGGSSGDGDVLAVPLGCRFFSSGAGG